MVGNTPRSKKSFLTRSNKVHRADRVEFNAKTISYLDICRPANKYYSHFFGCIS